MHMTVLYAVHERDAVVRKKQTKKRGNPMMQCVPEGNNNDALPDLQSEYTTHGMLLAQKYTGDSRIEKEISQVNARYANQIVHLYAHNSLQNNPIKGLKSLFASYSSEINWGVSGCVLSITIQFWICSLGRQPPLPNWELPSLL